MTKSPSAWAARPHSGPAPVSRHRLGTRLRRSRTIALLACGCALGAAVWLAQASAAEPATATAKPAPAAPAATPPAGAKPKTPAAGPASPAEALAQRLAVLRRKVLREEDFAENEESNRDPFRSYLDTWIDRSPKITVTTVAALCAKYSLEELTLIAVISGDANPRAMFRDPTGLGQVVKRGDYLSKSSARVTKILSDRVVLELSEMTPGGTTKALERAVLVNPEGTDQ
jgi:Tfp pilus assembly protein PilP